MIYRDTYIDELDKMFYDICTVGVTGAQWVGTEWRGLVKMSKTLCGLSLKLQKLEQPSPSVHSYPKLNPN